MAKDISMTTTENELKSIGKAVGQALKRAGHPVPHSVLLHALAAALDKRDWHTLKASLALPAAPSSAREPEAAEVSPVSVTADTFPSPTSKLMAPTVRAHFHTDDYVFEVDFDATPFFVNATEKALVDIYGCGFAGDYPTDAIAEFVADQGLNSELVEAFGYLNAVNRQGRKSSIGFECKVAPEDYLRWMDQHQPGLLAEQLCADYGVTLSESSMSERGMWWLWEDTQSGRKGAGPCTSRRTAALDAYGALGLLQTALKNEA